MINCTALKLLGDFNIAKNPSIITKSFCSGTDAGLGEIESITRIKEHPSYKLRRKMEAQRRIHAVPKKGQQICHIWVIIDTKKSFLYQNSLSTAYKENNFLFSVGLLCYDRA